jgi:iron complex transport system substrate-binding protein
VDWDDVIAARPEVLVLACCGYTVARTIQDLPIIQDYPGWEELPAVRDQQVYIVDGCAYFSRPGPRVVDSLEILAVILHPEFFGGRFPDRGTARLPLHPEQARR